MIFGDHIAIGEASYVGKEGLTALSSGWYRDDTARYIKFEILIREILSSRVECFSLHTIDDVTYYNTCLSADKPIKARVYVAT